jgi:protein-tyrosine phosphatase
LEAQAQSFHAATSSPWPQIKHRNAISSLSLTTVVGLFTNQKSKNYRLSIYQQHGSNMAATWQQYCINIRTTKRQQTEIVVAACAAGISRTP